MTKMRLTLQWVLEADEWFDADIAQELASFAGGAYAAAETYLRREINLYDLVQMLDTKVLIERVDDAGEDGEVAS